MTELAGKDEQTTDPTGPGTGTLLILAGLLAVGSLPLALFADTWDAWQTGALVGFALSGMLALSGWFATRRVFDVDQATFMKNVFGFMVLRLFLAGVVAGLVIGFGWLHAHGFIAGMFGGVLLFQAVEIGSVMAAAKRVAPPSNGPSDSAQGATGHAS